jgi:Predicted membrane protein
MEDDVKFCPKCGTQQPMGANNNENTDSGKFTGGSEFDRNPQPQSNHQQTMNNQNPNSFNNNYGNNFNGQYQNNFNSNQQNQQSYAGNFKMGQPNHLDFSQSMSYIWANKFDFNPTVQDNQKSIFWWSQLMVAILGIAVYIVLMIPAVALGSSLMVIVSGLLFIALYAMEIPPIMRRLNYLGKDKNMAWLFFVPFANLYILYLMFIDRSQVNHA